MGMSTHVSGIRDLDGQFAKMIALKPPILSLDSLSALG